jgi:hypothetical protein
MILSKEQLKQVISSLNPVESGNNYIIDCPSCGHRESSISIIKDSHPIGCYRLSKCAFVGNIYTLKKYGIHFKQEDKLTSSDFEIIDLNLFIPKLEKVILPIEKIPFGFKQVTQNDYLDSRGFSKRDYDYWSVGCASIGFLKNYVIFPISQDNEIRAYVARTFIKDFEPRYRNSISEFASILGGIDKFETCETLILCEGIFDTINVTRLLDLYDCKEIRSVCTFGAKISQNQINLIKSKGVKRAIILFDGDVIKKIKPIAFELSLYFEVEVAILEGVDIDAGNCTINQLEHSLINTHSPLEFNLNKIEQKL